MSSNSIVIKRFDSPLKAPSYNLPEFKHATLDQVMIVKKGTVGGKSTLDLVFTDENGQKHVAMITASIIRQVSEMVGVE